MEEQSAWLLNNLSATLNGSRLESDCIDVQQVLISDPYVQLAFCILYFIIFVVGILGNLLVLVVIVTQAPMQTTTNMYILNMAIADILMCLVSVPLTPLSTFLDRWIFGEVLCKFLPASQGTSVYVSTFTLTAIAVDRYQTIMHPFSSRPSLSATLTIIAALDLVSLLVTLPFSYFMRLGLDNTGTLQCQEGWESTPRMVFGNFTMLCQFVIPFTTIIFCYGKIMVRLRQRSAAGKPGTRSMSKRLAEEARTRRTNRMLIAMVIIFAISWFPINLINLLADCLQLDCWSLYYVMFFLSHVIAMSSTCYNPLLYGWFNTAFR